MAHDEMGLKDELMLVQRNIESPCILEVGSSQSSRNMFILKKKKWWYKCHLWPSSQPWQSSSQSVSLFTLNVSCMWKESTLPEENTHSMPLVLKYLLHKYLSMPAARFHEENSKNKWVEKTEPKAELLGKRRRRLKRRWAGGIRSEKGKEKEGRGKRGRLVADPSIHPGHSCKRTYRKPRSLWDPNWPLVAGLRCPNSLTPPRSWTCHVRICTKPHPCAP